MTQPTGSIRKLTYGLLDTLDMESVVGSGGIDLLSLDGWSDSDPDVRVPILLELSLNEYVALASSIDVGRDIAYGDNSIYIWWLWVRSIISMDHCQFILDCINDTPAIQQAIANYSLGSSIEGTTPEQQEILDTDVFGSQSPCDNDEIFGMTLQMTDLLNQVSEDILELFVSAFAIPGRIGDIIEAIPGLGILPYDDLLQIFEKLAEQVNDAYVAAYDTQIREDIACDLFCIATDTCTLTIEQARDYFQNKITETLDNTDFFSVVEDIIANNWIGEQSIYMMHWFILDTIIFGGEILGIEANRLVTTIATYFNDPDSDWSILCTACQWDCTTDFEAVDGNFAPTDQSPDPDWGHWTVAEGWNTDDIENTPTNFRRTVITLLDLADPVHVDNIQMTYDWTKGTFSIGSLTAIAITTKIGGQFGTVVSSVTISRDASVNGNDKVISDVVNDDIDFIQLYLRCSNVTTESFSGAGLITEFKIDGTGTKPPELEC